MDLKQPTTDKQGVLYTMIKQGSISLFGTSCPPGYRTRVSELRKQYPIFFKSENKKFKKKNGRTSTYKVHTITDIKKAIEIYKELTEK